MSLRFKLNAIIALLMGLFVAALIAEQIDATRRGVHEEVVAANRVAIQVLQRVAALYTQQDMRSIVAFLNLLGRLRSNEITVTDDAGQVLYRSPPPTYKQGRDAPAWFSAWIVPPGTRQEIALAGGRMVIESNPSRAVLDGWDNLVSLLELGGLAFVLVNVAVFWLVGRTLRPFPRIVSAFERLQDGDLKTRLPALPGREARMLGIAFNRMATAIEENIEARRRTFEAERRLSESRELTQLIERRIEEERREIARELHDELGQSVTAIRSVALALAQRFENSDEQARSRAALIADQAKNLHDAMHGLIPRLAPLTLDSLGLADTLSDLVGQARVHHPDVRFDLQLAALPDVIDPGIAFAAYRVAQEGLTNALRHSGARNIRIDARARDGALEVSIEDDGCGMAESASPPPGRFGLRGLRERVGALAGRLEVSGAPGSGTMLRAVIPLAGAAA